MKYLIFVIFAALVGTFSVEEENLTIAPDTKIWDVLEMLGDDAGHAKPNMSIANVSAETGYNIITQGFSEIQGQPKAKRQSKHFVCTSCHNIEREDPDLTVTDPQARLDYVSARGIPLLQGSPLYGAANREYFYNGYYVEKYGALVDSANENLRESVNLCALECAQGRKLKEWEMESIVAYLWEIQLKMSDLNLTKSEIKYISSAIEDSLSWDNASAILHSKYLSYSPATFVKPPSDRKVGTGLKGDPDNGQKVYNSSCLHCHYRKKYSYLNLDDNDMSFNYLNKKIATYDRQSIYQVIRYGTYTKYWKKSYMPLYTQEKMTDQMLADLRAYIEKRANI
ncbi:MAG: cytochrome c [Saprospiraceae bacterium]